MLARPVITRRGRRFRGYFPSKKMGRMVAWESLLELDAILLLEISQGVVSYQEQPALIQYAQGTEQREYYPDLEVILNDGSLLHLEVKASRELDKPDIAGKYQAIAADYVHRDFPFRVVTEQEIRREPLLSNAQLLFSLLRHPSPIDLDTTRLEEMSFPTSFESAAATLGRKTLLRLIAYGHLACDITQPLEGGNLIDLAKGDQDATILL